MKKTESFQKKQRVSRLPREKPRRTRNAFGPETLCAFESEVHRCYPVEFPFKSQLKSIKLTKNSSSRFNSSRFVYGLKTSSHYCIHNYFLYCTQCVVIVFAGRKMARLSFDACSCSSLNFPHNFPRRPTRRCPCSLTFKHVSNKMVCRYALFQFF